jgi:sec-independent protein translocase protein TatC
MNPLKKPDRETDLDMSPRERAMSFWDHLDEFRGTIIKSVCAFVFFAALIGYYLKEFDRALMSPFNRVAAEFPHLDLKLGTQTPMEGLNVVIQMCMFGGLLLAAPFVLFFISQFVAPALTRRELKTVLPMCVSASVLFLLGASFGFYLLVPTSLRVMIEINQSFGWDLRWTVGGYYTILTRLVLGVGAAFQFPLLIVLLSWLGLVSAAFLRKYRRHAVVAIFLLAALVTPTSDPLNQMMFAAPLYLLYEVAILAAARIEKSRERSGHAILLALVALWPRGRNVPRGLAVEC